MTLLLLHARTLQREEFGAENTWQEDMDMPDASPTPSTLVDVVSHSGFGPPHLILAARRHTHSHLSQSLLHRITWHEADSVAQHEVERGRSERGR